MTVDSADAFAHTPRVTSHHEVVNTRRADLDWIRVGAFGLLILFHTALVYAPYDWHIQSVHRFDWMPEALLLTGPWRLTLLFLVSGAALRFMTARRTPRQVAKARFERLGPPLLMGVVFLVSLQSWIEAMDNGWWDRGYLAWLAREFGPGLFNGVPVNHLWFVLYIGLYSLLAVLLMRREGLVPRLEERLLPLIAGWRVLIVPAAFLILIRITLFPVFGITNGVLWDPYNHILSFGVFLFGFLVVRREEVWRDLERYRWISLGLAAVCLPLMMWQWVHPGGGAFLGIPKHFVQGLDQWMVIAAILGFGSRHLRSADGPVLRYLTDAVFPCYLAHQTILVAAVWFIRPANLPALPEALLLIAVTFGGSLLVYEVVRRIPSLRPWWGLKPVQTEAAAPFTRRRVLLRMGVAGPLLTLVTFVAAVLAYPGFDHATQYLSELGGATARMPEIFNFGVFVAGVLAGLTGLGFGLTLVALSRAWLSGVLTAGAFVVAGVGLAGSTFYPWPDPRHMIVSLGLGIQIAPLLLLWGLRDRKDLPRLKLFLGGVFLAMAVLTLFTKHLIFPGTVNDTNVGWWERVYAFVLIGWAAVAAFMLERRLRQEAANPL